VSTGRFLFVLLFSVLLVHSELPANPAPRIELQERVFDFREMVEGQPVEHVFRVRNRGDQPLEIRNVKPG
jgi:uncharacterized protein (DUF58 family)